MLVSGLDLLSQRQVNLVRKWNSVFYKINKGANRFIVKVRIINGNLKDLIK